MKTKLIYLVFTFFGFLTPLKGLFFLVGFAVLLDTSYAIYSVIKLDGIKKIRSTKLFNVAVKTFFYFGTILLGYLIDLHILNGSALSIESITSKIVCATWVIIESKSIDETNQKLGNKPFLDVIKSSINKIKEIKKDLNDLKD